MSIRTVVVDDHPVTRAGTIAILQRDGNIQVVGEAADGEQALMVCRALCPDLLVLDMRLPKLDGIMVVHLLKATDAAPRILVLSAFPDTALVRAALDAGASGYVLKSVAGAELLAAIHSVMRGDQVLLGVDSVLDSGDRLLSRQEMVVLSYVAQGLITKEIAHRLGIGTRTVETHLARIFDKLGASTRTEAVAIAHRKGLLTME